MPKISKNIKKFRAEKQLTQDALAEKLHVTRQAISNWENDKTKPDIEALEALAIALEVEIEELIYGEKKEIIASQEKTKEKNRIKLILAIIGSLFVASGLALVFFGFWQNFALPLQTALSLIPMLLGQAVAVFTCFKKKDSITWREAAAVIWTVGIVSTIALIDYIYDISWVYTDYLIVDSFLILPVIFIFGAVAPFVFYCYMTIHISTVGDLQHIIFSLLFFAIGVLYTYLLSRNKEDFRGKGAQWAVALTSIPLISIYVYAVFESDMLENYALIVSVCLLSYFLSAFIATPHNLAFSFPHKPLSIIGLCVTATVLTFTVSAFVFEPAEIIMSIVLIFIPLIIAVLKREELSKNIAKVIAAAISLAILIVTFVLSVVYVKEADFYIMAVLAIALGGAFVYYGIKELRLFPINLGLITAFIQIISIYASFSSPDVFVLGLLLAVFGAVIIVLNWKMLSVKKSLKEQLSGGDDNA